MYEAQPIEPSEEVKAEEKQREVGTAATRGAMTPEMETERLELVWSMPQTD